MKKVTERQQQIIKYLLTNGESKCKNISQAINVSDKTIRNEIKSINNTFNFSLIISTLKGFYINEKYINQSIQLVMKDTFDENILI